MFVFLALVGFWLWGQVEKMLFRRALAAYKPVPVPLECSYNSNQVSVLVCTVNTLLARSLRTWLANNPLEVIIVTVEEHLDQIRSVVADADLAPSDYAKVTILASPVKGKRAQMAAGIPEVHGSIIANVDDHITWHPDFLRSMLPCLEDERLGAVGPTIEGVIPEDRQDAKIITPYEVAAQRVNWNRTPRSKVAWSAGRWSWGVTGVTYLVRAHILKDPAFLEGYENDSWRDRKLDVGEDTFVSRWLQSHDWTISIQDLGPETTVFRTVKRTSDFFYQMFRWERSTIQSHIRQAQLKQTYQSLFVARKTWGRILRPWITTLHILSWIFSMMSQFRLSLLVLALYIVEAYPGYKSFFEKYPYMRQYWWAAVAQDYFYVVQDYWCWYTLDDTSWEARQVSVEDQKRIN